MRREVRERRATILAVTVAALATLIVLPLNYASAVQRLAWRPTLLEYVLALLGTYAALGVLAYAGWRAGGGDTRFAPPTRGDLEHAALGILATLVVGGALVALVRQFGLPVAQPNLLAPPLEGFAGGPSGPARLLVVLPLFALVVVPVEEVLFRTVVQARLARAFAAREPIVVASALFALFTVPVFVGGGLVSTLVPVGVAFVLSLVWGGLYHRTRNVLVPASAHALAYVVGLGGLILLASLARG